MINLFLGARPTVGYTVDAAICIAVHQVLQTYIDIYIDLEGSRESALIQNTACIRHQA